MRVVLFSKPNEVSAFVETVRARSDLLKETFGFLPDRAYRQMAEQGKLFVATGRDENGAAIYTGHLLFGGAFPHGRIVQIHVDEAHRRKGVGRQLIQALVRRAQAQHYLSLRARVASDLFEANVFYERLNFHHIQTVRGGSARHRKINIRVRELDTPHLFEWATSEFEPKDPEVRLPARTRPEGARYVIDLNVLFDVLKKRPRSEAAGWIVSAGLNNVVRLAVTEELIEELQRTSHAGQGTPDPILEMATKLPRIARPPESEIIRLTDKLGKMIFPERTTQGRLTDQDRSDLIHLITSIHHQVAGFITAEKAVLRASEELRSTYGINIMGPDEFAAATEPVAASAISNFTAEIAGTVIRVQAIDDRHDRSDLLDFLERMFVPVQERGEFLSSGATGAPVRRLAVRSGEELVALCSYQMPNEVRSDTDLFLCADQDHSSAAPAIDHLLDRVCREVTQNGPALIRLRQFLGHALTREVAVSRGFHSGATSDRFAILQKGCVGVPVGPAGWNETVRALKTRVGLSLPDRIPTYEGPMQLVPVQVERQSLEVPLQYLEPFCPP
jgi:GNAT superfamily N-acetyltransferase